jgi:hypothetical protein
MNRRHLQFEGRQIPSRSSSPVHGLHYAVIFIDALFFPQTGGFLNEVVTDYTDYQAIKNVTVVKPVRYLCEWFLTYFQSKLSVSKGHRLTAIKSLGQSSILSHSRTISQDHSNTLLLGCQNWMPKNATENRLPCKRQSCSQGS